MLVIENCNSLSDLRQKIIDGEEVRTARYEPCGDAISRQATVERLCKLAAYINERRRGAGSPYVMAALFIQDNKDEFPPVTPKPKTGHWIRELIRNEKGGCIGAKMICSECGNDNKHDEYMNYCPNCGAKMVEPQEGEGV